MGGAFAGTDGYEREADGSRDEADGSGVEPVNAGRGLAECCAGTGSRHADANEAGDESGQPKVIAG